MQELALSLFIMLLGSLLPIWLKAVAACGVNDFNWRIFIGENFARFVLCLVGVLIVGVLLYLDAGGVAQILEPYGLEVKLGASAITGSAISAYVFMKSPTN